MPKVILPLSLLFAVGLIQTAAAAACEGYTRPSIHVIAEPAPVSVSADFSLSDISDLAHRVGEPHEQAPMGFYMSTVIHQVSVQVEPGPTTTCAENCRSSSPFNSRADASRSLVRFSGNRVGIGRSCGIIKRRPWPTMRCSQITSTLSRPTSVTRQYR